MPSMHSSSSQSIARISSTTNNRNSNKHKTKAPLLSLRDIQVIHGCRINDKLELCFILEIFNNKGIKVEVPKRNVSSQTLDSNTFLKFYQSHPFNVQSLQELEHKLISSIKQIHHKHIASKQSLDYQQMEAPQYRMRAQINISQTVPIICSIKENQNVNSVCSKIQYVRNKVNKQCHTKKQKHKKRNKKAVAPISNLTSIIPRKPPNTYKNIAEIKSKEDKIKDLSSALTRIKPVKPPITRSYRRDTCSHDASSSLSSDVHSSFNYNARNPPNKRMEFRSKRYAIDTGRIITANAYEMNCAKIMKHSDEMLAEYKQKTMLDFENDMKKIDQLFQYATNDLIV